VITTPTRYQQVIRQPVDFIWTNSHLGDCAHHPAEGFYGDYLRCGAMLLSL